MSISANFPNVRPSLLLDFAQSQQLDPRVTFSRSTTAPYYDGKTSVLAEQNLLIYSQNFSLGWGLGSVTQTANTVVAPDGTTTGTTLTDTSVTNTFNVQQSKTGTAGAYTGSMYFQAGTLGYAYVQVTDGAFRYTVLINLSTGAFATSSSTGSPTGTSYVITQVGSWWRLAVTVNLTGSTIYLLGGLSNTASPTFSFGNAQYTGTGTGTIYVWGAQLEQRSSATAYNATTTSALTNYIPQLLTAPINQPRFDFNPTTGESLGLLIEQSSTNLNLYSQLFDNSYWTKSNATITTAANIAPDGTQTFQKLVESATTGEHYVARSVIAVTSGISYTYSIYLKASERTRVRVGPFYGFGATGGGGIVLFVNLSNGTIISSANGTAALVTNIVSVGNSCYRVTISDTAYANEIDPQINLVSTGTTVNYTGDGYSGIYIWGAQLEALPLATSYIPTTSAQVTRASDNASMTGANFSSWYNQAEGTLYAEASTVSNGNACVYGIGDSTSNIIRMFKQNGNQAVYQVVKDATFSANLGMATTWTSGYGKIASVYKTDDFATSYNGGTSVTDTSGAVPIVNTVLTIGIGAGVASLNGYIKKIAYYPIRVTNTQLQALTGS